MVSKVIFVGRATAETIPGWQDWAMISITEPDPVTGNAEAKVLPGWRSLFRTAFHDITPDHPKDAFLTLMDEQHAREIVAFVRQIATDVEGIMIHCKAGISRSAAVAKWIAMEYGLPFNHDYEKFNRHVYDLLVEAGKETE